ncbi:MAG: hypothetical protein J0M26_06640 [Planctomycetes bacterium]|nr:hypothetical protein [Planctomycetota bacterium]
MSISIKPSYHARLTFYQSAAVYRNCSPIRINVRVLSNFFALKTTSIHHPSILLAEIQELLTP